MPVASAPRLLLTTVCSPYGVQGRDSEALGMQMELLNNQITREQGVHSPRANFWTFPLYFLAENINVPATVLDFPSWRVFKKALQDGYTHVGISFIQTNVLKARRMAEYIRNRLPQTKIILGGYGAGLPDVRRLVPCDEVCPGEGVGWLRSYFGEDKDRPVRHPVMNGVIRKYVYGIHCRTDESAVIFPGLGCSNACFFCSTSSKFGHEYIPFLDSGKDVFDLCRRCEDELGVREFAIIDENFLLERNRARELLAEMEREGKDYNFSIFSSAEVLSELGVDFLVRLGVCAVWVGVETSADVFGKVRNIDAGKLIAELQQNGISAISSSILFMEHHDREMLEKDIEWAIGLGSDMHQFMQLTPLPGTPLYEQYRSEGKLIGQFPYTRMSGQNALNFYHPHFGSEEAGELTRLAFRRKFEAGGPAVVNMARTILRGYRSALKQTDRRDLAGMSWNPDSLRYDRRRGAPASDSYMRLRLAAMRRRLEEYRPVLLAGWLFSPNAGARRRCGEVIRDYAETLGPPCTLGRLKSAAVAFSAGLEHLRICAGRVAGRPELIRQPPVRRVSYFTNGAGQRESREE